MTARRFADRPASELVWLPPSGSEPLNFFRPLVDSYLNAPLTDREWALLENQGLVASIKRQERNPAQVAALVEQWRQAVDEPNRRPRSGSVPPGMRAAALAELLAAEARRMAQVIEFRQKVLHGQLLPPDQIQAWFDRMSQQEPPAMWVRVYLSREEFKRRTARWADHPVAGLDTLCYAVPEGRREPSAAWRQRSVPLPEKGTLRWLKGLAEQLSRRFLWQEAWAVDFLLADLTPPIYELTYAVDEQEVRALTRVRLEIDPTLPPRVVAEVYKEVRSQYFGGRHRSMTPKHLELARFWAAAPEGRTWRALREEWNRLHPNWAYQRNENFARDCAQARKRLLHQSIVLPSFLRRK